MAENPAGNGAQADSAPSLNALAQYAVASRSRIRMRRAR